MSEDILHGGPVTEYILHGGPGLTVILDLLAREIQRQDKKHGRFEGTELGKSRLAIACLEDEVKEALDAWRDGRTNNWYQTRTEVLQVAAVALRALRDTM